LPVKLLVRALELLLEAVGNPVRPAASGLRSASADGPSNTESATISGPEFKPGKYVVRVSNFAAVEPYDGTVTFNKTPRSDVELGLEKWTLVCRERKGGPVRTTQKVLVKRGDVAHVELASACD
jgi:hypothetical protein